MPARAPSILTERRLSRSALLRSTALQATVALVLAAPAAAQPAPNARPLGGQVVAGTASIANTTNTTTINQSTNRAAINWTSFDVGSQQAVTFQQPSSNSVTLNRVTAGDPSSIAGKITANGQIVLTNPSGVTFFPGAEVNAQSVVVSAAGITNRNFMAGRMAFDQAPNPNARIDNRGTITVRQAGLAALVAPSVANSGTINAKLGQVVLAGAASHTLDMYGDGLVAIDVTKQVTQAPVGPDGKVVTALVTNTGTIRADGGVVQLTAKAADGVVQTLVRAGGHIRADSVGSTTGRIEIAGTGGSVVVEGRVAADGRAPGTTGGQVMVAGSGTTTLAATAHVSASGHAGGGTVAIGTTLARAAGSGAAPAGTSARTIVASGARVSADATKNGNGGRVTVLSTDSTAIGGALTARGGRAGGDGGTVEMSGETGFRLTGTADTSAPHGNVGSIVLDPRDLTITATPNGTANASLTSGANPTLAPDQGGATTDAYVTPAQIQALTGKVYLQTTRDLTVASSVTYNDTLFLYAGRNLTVNSGVTVSVTNGHTTGLYAGSSVIPGYDASGALTINGAVTAYGVNLGAGTGGITIAGSVTGTNAISVNTTGAMTQTASGSVTTTDLVGTAGSVALTLGSNAITGIGVVNANACCTFTTTAGGFSLVNTAASGTLSVGGVSGTALSVPAGQTIALSADTMSLVTSGGQTLSAPGGTIALSPTTATRGITLTGSSSVPGGTLILTPAELASTTAGTLQLGRGAYQGNVAFGQAGETIDLTANGGYGTLALATTGSVTQGGPLVVGALTGSAGTVTLANTGNSIPLLKRLTSTGDITLATANSLTVTGAVGASRTVILNAGADLGVASTGSVTAPQGGTLNAGGTLTAAGPVTAGGLSLRGGAGGIAFSADVDAGSGLTLTTSGAVTQTAGGITAGDLSGNAGSVALTSRTNAISGIATTGGNFTTSGGLFTLVDSMGLRIGGGPSVGGGLSVASAGTISLATDSLTLNGSGSSSAVSAPSGTFAIAPFTSGTGVLLTSSGKPGGVLALTTGELAQVTAGTLQIGALDGGGVPTAGAVTFGKPGEAINLTANGGFGTLDLVASGAVTQGGPLTVATLTGQAGSLALTNTGNAVTSLAGFITTAGDLALSTGSGLTVTGTVTANGGTGDIALAAGGPTGQYETGSRPIWMLLTGNLTGSAVTLDINTPSPSISGGIDQPGGSIVATTVSGGNGYFIRLYSGANRITQAGDVASYEEDGVSSSTPLLLTGRLSSQTYAVALGGAGITQAAGSAIVAPQLDVTSSANTVLTNASNAIQSVGAVTQTAGDFSVASSVPLSLGGNFATISATSGSLFFVADSIGLLASKPATLSAPQGVIGFAPLTTNRRIELIGATSADPNSLSVSQALLNNVTAAQVIALGNASSTGAINIANAGETVTIPVNATLDLRTTGAVTEGISPGGQTGGGTLALVASGVSGATGDITLAAPANQILGVGYGTPSPASLYGLTSTGSVDIVTSTSLGLVNAITANATNGTLTVSAGGALTTAVGPFTASAINLSAGTGDLTLANAVTTGGNLNTVSLTSTGGNVIATNGAITTGALTASGNTVVLPNTGNAIAALAGTAPGGLTVYDSVPLTVNNTLSTGNLSVTDPGGFTVNGNLSAAGVSVSLGGAFSEGTNGRITATTLGGSAQSASLTAATNNQIGTLGDFTTTGGFALATGVPNAADNLAISGTLTAGGAVAIQNYGPVALSGTVTAPTVAITANSTQGIRPPQPTDGTITQSGGSVTAGTITLTNGDGFSQTGGSLIGTGPAGSIAISTNGALSLGGTLSAPTVSLTALTRSVNGGPVAGTVAQTGGSITGSVTGHSDSTTALTASGNAITGLAGFSSTGGFSLSTGQPLAVTGTVTDATSIALSVAGGLSLGASLTGGAVTLNTTGAVTQTAGALTATTLGGSTGGVTLLSTGNAVQTLNTFAAGGAFSLADSVPLSIAGAVSVPTGQTLTLLDNAPAFASGGSLSAPGGTVTIGEFTPGNGLTVGGPGGFTTMPAVTAATLSLGTAAGGPLTIAGALNLSSVTTLNLQSGGAISETGAGAIQVATLSGSGASAALGGANRLGTLGAFTTKGAFNLTNAQDLAVAGPLSVTTASLSVTGNLGLSGTVGASTSLALNVSGAITQSGGSITTPSLGGTAGSAAFGSTTNAIATLAGFTSTGAFGLTDGQALTIGGAVSGSQIGLTAQSIAVNAAVSGGPVSLTATGAITEGAGGTVTATTLTGSAGSATLGSSNQVATLGSFTTATGLTLVDGQALTVAGPVSDGQSVSLSTTGVLTVSGSLTAPAVTLASANGPSVTGGIVQTAGTITGATSVTLTSAAAIGQTGGTITTGTLTGSSAGTTTLTSSGNQVASLSGFSSAGGFNLVDASALTVAGPVTDGTAVTLKTAGALSLNGTVQTGALSLTASSITQPGGSLIATSLTGGTTTGGAALSQRTNQIGTLDAFASAGPFSLVDSTALGIAGAVSAGPGTTLTITDDAPSFAPGGSLTASGGTVALREFTPGRGITLGGGNGLSGDAPIAAATLSVGSPAGGPVVIAGAFNLTTVGTLDLESGGAISETGAGSVRVGTLTGNGASAALGGANQIGTLGAFTTAGAFALTNAQTLAVAGPLSASTAALSVTGDLVVSGTVSAPMGVSLVASGAITQPGGGITTASLTGNATSAALGSATNAIGTLAGFTTTGAFSLTDGQALTVGGAVSGSQVGLTATSLAVNAAVSGGPVSLVATGAITEGTAGTVTASTLTGSAGSATLGTSNQIATLGGFTTSTGLTLVDGRALTVTGPVTDGQSISLSAAGPLTLSGALTAPSVTLVATNGPSVAGAISQTAGTITAVTLSGSSAGTTALTSAGNQVATLAAFNSNGGFSLADASALAVTGPVSDSTAVTLNTAGALALSGTVQTGALSLTAGDAITQPGGSISATSLTGSAASAALTANGNTVGSLAAFTTTGPFTLSDSAALTVTGAVSVGTGQTLTLFDDAPTFGAGGSLSAPGGTVALREYTAGRGITVAGGGSLTGTPPVSADTLVVGAPTGGPITIAGAFNLSGVAVLDLESSGAITETGAGAIRVGTLTGNGASAALGGANQVGILGAFATAGAFALTDAQALTVTGPVSATTAALSVNGGLGVSGTISAPTGVSLTATGAITQTGGSIATASLSGSAASAGLGSTGNAIATLAGFTTTGAFSLTDGQALTVGGAVSGSQVGLSAPAIAVNAGVSGGPVSLVSTGAVTEGMGGVITASTLSGSAGSATLGTANQVATLGSFATMTGFSLVDGRALTVTGPVSDGQSISLNTTGPLILAGVLGAPSVTLVAVNGPGAAGTISQTAGTITAGTLSGSSAGTTALTSAGNQVATLAGFNSNGGFSLADASALAVTGPVSDSTAVTLNTAGALALSGTVQTGALSLTAGGAITQPGGSISATSLTGSAASAALTANGNTVGSLAAFTTTGPFTLSDSAALTVTGAVSVGTGQTLTLFDDAPTFGAGGSLSAPGGTVALREYTAGRGITVAGGGSLTGTPPVSADTLVVGAPTGGPITIAGAFNLSSVAVLDLESSGAITETGAGAIRVGTLTGNGASAALGGANQVGTLGAFTTSGAFALTDAQALTVAGPLSAQTVALNVTGDLALSGTVTAPIGVSLTASGTISQPGGSITTASLTGSAAAATLGQAANAVGQLAGFTATVGSLSFTDGQALTVSGDAAANTRVSLAAPSLALNAGISADAVFLTADGAITEGAGGRITAASLSGSAGSATLGTANLIGTLGSFRASTGLTLADNQALNAAGVITAGDQLSLSAAGPLTLSGTLSARSVTLVSTDGPGGPGAILDSAGSVTGTNSVTLVSSGAIQQTSGVVNAGVLNGSSGGVTALAGAGNQVTTLAGFSSTGGFSLADRQSLTVTGPVSDATSVSLSTNGGLTLSGSLQTGALSLMAASITQPGGTITATSLTGNAGAGGVALTQRTNQIAALLGFSSAGPFSLVDSAPLSIAGPVAAGPGATLAITDDQPSFAAGGSLTAPNGTVSLQEFTPGNGLTIGGPGTFAPGSAVNAGTLSLGSPTGGPLTIAGALNLAGATTLNLQSGFAITETGAGAIQAAALTGSGASASLGGANRIGTLGAFTTAGPFALTNAQGLTVAGPLSATASTAALSVDGNLVLAGTITAPTGLSLNASGAIIQTGGSIVTASLTGNAASAALTSGTNSVGTLAGFTTTGDFNLTDGRSLVVSAPVDPNVVTLTVAGDLALNSTVTGGTVVLNVTGAITEGGAGQLVTPTLTGSAGSATLSGTNLIGSLGDLHVQGALILADAQSLSVAGAVTAGTAATIGTQGMLSVPGSIAVGTATAPGTLTLNANGAITVGGALNAGTLAVTGGDALTQTGGTITAGTLTGTVTGQASLGSAGIATIGTVNNLVSGVGVGLVDSGPLQISGVLAAPNLAISATGALVLNNGVIAANGLPASGQTGATPALPGSYLQVLTGADGTATLLQLGTTTIIPLTGTSSALRLDLPATGGTLTLAGLNAPQTDLVLGLGSGTGSGTLNAGNLTVLGSGGSAQFTGSVRSQTAFDAAEISRIAPEVNTVYTLNGCAIQAASCSPDTQTITSVAASVISSTIRPDILVLDVLDLSVTRDRDDPTLLLPNISDRDY